jgi:hypothetical protein
MARKRKKTVAINQKKRRWVLPLVAVLVLGLAGVAYLAAIGNRGANTSRETASRPAPAPANNPTATGAQPGAAPAIESMEVAKAVMVTAELDFGSKVPTVAEALNQIERRYVPEDGTGRTFAILDADGWPTPDGKLHIQMHVSSEKPGLGSLIFRRTGQVLWNSRITGSPVSPNKSLNILVENGAGQPLTVDGSANPSSVLEARVKELNAPVKTVWADGEDREMTFIYSACGCPVKVMARRVGDKTIRVPSKRLDGSARDKDLPVMFPDDPAAVSTISRLMGWQN